MTLRRQKGVLQLIGTVIDGDQKAKVFVSQSGYTDQFEDCLGYRPYPVTLNIELDEESKLRRKGIEDLSPVEIKEWTDDDGTNYGAVYCYPCRIDTAAVSVTTCHVVVPKRTDHGKDVLEVIAPERLRDALDVSDSDTVTVTVSTT